VVVFAAFLVTTLHLTVMSSHHIAIVLAVVSFPTWSLPVVIVLVERRHVTSVVVPSLLVVVVIIVAITLASLIVHHSTVIVVASIALFALMATWVVITIVELTVATCSVVMVFVVARATAS
jgi:hypothetical protein